MKALAKKFFTDESGQGMVEYALILALVSIVAIVTLTGLGTTIMAKFQEIAVTLGWTPPS
ncbi:MAG: Flp family type IVb pilin [Dethiobacter sp.]|jgi:pilus assembly protein Flp/PilA|nr:Flp family type IVb pilin [Dethiobacter sp.]